MNRRQVVQILGSTAVTLGGAPLLGLTRDHVIVAGAGIIGASIAYHLAKRGARVTLLEKEHPAAGTTKNSFAWLNASEKSPRSYYDLNLAGIAGWRRLELDLGASLPIQWGGGVQWCKPEAQLPERMRQHVKERQSWGYSIRLIDRDDLLRLIPSATPGEIGAANFADQEGTVDPIVAANALVSAAKSLGATVIYPCEVKDFHLAEGRVRAVITTQGSMEADYVVLATGNGATELAAKAGMHVPLKESKGILAHTAPQPEVLRRVMMPPGADVKQNFDGRIVTGANFGDTGDAQPTMELGRQYLAAAARYFPQLRNATVEYMTLGYRVMPQDGHPIIGRSPKFPNFYVAALHSGMTCAPIVGQLAATEILDQVDVDLLQPYRAARFSA
ncbi:MAG: FAD-binding oxidoreductase [Bryobacteraceae bacterium]|jgi:glycine/D-amino acid oxidase-like deaminating enzyme